MASVRLATQERGNVQVVIVDDDALVLTVDFVGRRLGLDHLAPTDERGFLQFGRTGHIGRGDVPDFSAVGRIQHAAAGNDFPFLFSLFFGFTDAGGDHGDAHGVAHVVVDDRAPDDFRVVTDFVVNALGGFGHLFHGQIAVGGDVHQHPLGTGNIDIFQKRVGDGPFRRFQCPVIAAGDADAHDGHAGPAHGGLHVGEVQVDQPGHHDQVGDALDRMEQDLIGFFEHVHHLGVLRGQSAQPVIGDGNHRVGGLAQLKNALFRLLCPFASLEGEGPGHHGHGENSHLLADLSDHRRGTGSRATTETGGDKDHVRIGQGLLDHIGIFHGRFPPHLGIGAGPEAFGDLGAQLNAQLGLGNVQSLGVGIGADELDALEVAVDHVVDRIPAGTTDPNDFDFCRTVILHIRKHIGHRLPLFNVTRTAFAWSPSVESVNAVTCCRLPVTGSAQDQMTSLNHFFIRAMRLLKMLRSRIRNFFSGSFLAP
ncbi:hypothetical protein DESC_480092 [Desulfosarcina cetonica]|nr:hypothetical protein DESC_480092 [Desulfosarcina cetonica]